MTISNYGVGPAGVSVSVDDGFLQNIVIGRPQKCVIFARGDLGTAEVNPNTPRPLQFRPDAERLFGQNSALAEQLRKALDNGAQKRTELDDGTVVPLLYGVAPDEISVTGEEIAGGTGTVAEVPLIEEKDAISITETKSKEKASVQWAYESPPSAPADKSAVAVNPNTGEIEAADSNDYTLDYKHLDWAGAMESARDVIEPEETGMWGVCSTAAVVGQQMSGWMDTLREPYRLVRGVVGAEPNATGPNGEPLISVFDNAGNYQYEHAFNDDATWMPGNVIRPNGRTIIGGITGTMAGHQLRDPIYGDALQSYPGGVVQTLRTKEQNELRRDGVLPITDVNNTLTLADSCSTYQYTTGDYLNPETLVTWTRDFHRRRIVDQMILAGNAAGQFGLKRQLTDNTLQLVKEFFTDTIKQFIEAGLLQSGTPSIATTEAQSGNAANGGGGGGGGGGSSGNEGSDGYSVEVVALAPDTIGIAATFQPTGVVKYADVRLSVARQETQTFSEATSGGGDNSGGDNSGGGSASASGASVSGGVGV